MNGPAGERGRTLSLIDVEVALELARGSNPHKPSRRTLEVAISGLGRALRTHDPRRGSWETWRDVAVQNALDTLYSRSRAGVVHVEDDAEL